MQTAFHGGPRSGAASTRGSLESRTLHRLRDWVGSAFQSPKDKLVKERSDPSRRLEPSLADAGSFEWLHPGRLPEAACCDRLRGRRNTERAQGKAQILTAA
jgi:hypothetical protein